MTDMVVSENTAVAAPRFFGLDERSMATRAGQIANVLREIIDKQKLAVRIGPNSYVKCEGWSTLGAFLGILPRERDVKELPNGDYEAYVDLVRQADGVVVGGASALCSVDEKRWSQADRYARRSMAITRATGKAYRLGYAWILTMAGYSPTPYEEMPHDEEPAKPRKQGYDPHDRAHQDKLIAELKRRGVDEARWDDIGFAMQGKSFTELEKVLAQ